MSAIIPEKFGATIAVTDSTSLAALDPAGLTLGTTVYNLATQTFWVMMVSTAALGPSVVAVSGITGVRWIEQVAQTGLVTLAELAATTIPSGASFIGVNNATGLFSEPDLQHVLEVDMVTKIGLAANDGTGGASLVGVQNTGGYYGGLHVLEPLIQAIGAKDTAQDASISGVTTLVADKLRAVAARVIGANGSFEYDELSYVGSAPYGSKWLTNGSATPSTTYATAIDTSGSVSIDIFYRQPLPLNLRTRKWFVAGVFKFDSTADNDVVMGVTLDDGTAVNNGIFCGLNGAISTAKFSCQLRIGDAATASALSTVSYDNNWHVFYAWGDGTQVKFSVDFETEVLVTNTMTNVFNGTATYQVNGTRKAHTGHNNAIHYDAVAIGHDR